MTILRHFPGASLGGNFPPGQAFASEPGLRQQFAEFPTPDISDLLNH